MRVAVHMLGFTLILTGLLMLGLLGKTAIDRIDLDPAGAGVLLEQGQAAVSGMFELSAE